MLHGALCLASNHCSILTGRNCSPWGPLTVAKPSISVATALCTNSLVSAPFSSPQDFLTLSFFKVRRPSQCDMKGSPAMGEPNTTDSGQLPRSASTCCALWGGRDSNPHESHLSADFKSSEVLFKPYHNM